MDAVSSGVKTPAFYLPVAGTHGWNEDPYKFDWWERGSAFNGFMAERNILLHPRSPFEWSTELDGMFQRNFATWKAAARHLTCHLDQFHTFDRNIIAHSHGGQVAILAAFYGCKIRNLITVGTPVRKEIEDLLPAAVGNIGYWLHIADGKNDMWSVFGAIGDGRVSVRHFFDMADRNDNIKGTGAGHTGILMKREFFPLWDTYAWHEELRKERSF